MNLKKMRGVQQYPGHPGTSSIFTEPFNSKTWGREGRRHKNTMYSGSPLPGVGGQRALESHPTFTPALVVRDINKEFNICEVIPGLLAFFYTVPLARSSLSSPSPPSFQGALSACPEAGRSPCTVFPLPLPTILPTLPTQARAWSSLRPVLGWPLLPQ